MGCYQRLDMPETSMAAIRARTPTSAGMNAVHGPKEALSENNAAVNKKYWNLLGSQFGIKLRSIIRARHDIQERISFLLEDALKGQCTPDHSCGDGIKNVILKIKDKEGNVPQQTVADE